MRRIGTLVLLVALLAGAAASQAVIYGPGTTRAFGTAYTGAHTVVRDSQANLYVIYRHAVNTLTQWDMAIARSSDNGATWNMTWQKGFAYLGSDFGSYHPCMAIDGNDNLHCAWLHRVAFTGSRLPQTIRYNRFEAKTATWGKEVTVTPTPDYEINNPVLAVDGNNFVWFSHGIANSSWDSVLDRSDKAYADGLTFTRFAPAAFSGGSYSQHVSLAVDKMGRVHTTYYDTSGYAGVKHQWIDPLATTPAWTMTSLSKHGPTNHTSRAEYNSRMAADFNGNVYAIYNVDDQAPTTGRTGNTETYLRKWDGTATAWGKPTLVQSVPSSIWTATAGANDGRFISGACDEGSDTFYFCYRDFTSGDFVVGTWNGDDTQSPATFAHLMNTNPLPANSRNYFFIPKLRGTLYPTANRTAWGLHLLYVVGDQDGAKTYTDYFESLPLGQLASTGTPKIGTTYKMDLTALAEAKKSYATALCVTGLGTVIAVDRRFIPLLPDAFFYLTAANTIPSVFVNFSGILDTSGMGQSSIVIPNASVLVGVKAYTAFVTYPGGPKGVGTISNPFSFTLVP